MVSSGGGGGTTVNDSDPMPGQHCTTCGGNDHYFCFPERADISDCALFTEMHNAVTAVTRVGSWITWPTSAPGAAHLVRHETAESLRMRCGQRIPPGLARDADRGHRRCANCVGASRPSFDLVDTDEL